MEKRMNCKAWPQSDLEMMKATMKDYIDSEEPFLAYYMTVSGHFQYNFSDNSMAYKNRKLVNNLNVSTAAKAYVATQIELDRALEYVIKTLEENNKLDNTVIVLLADHYPYKLDLKSINSLSSYQRDNLIEVNHNNLILWNNNETDTHISKPCMSSDVLPTVYNLFGVKYDSRLLTGRDILSTSDGLVIFNNHSWITDKGVYHANTKKFDGDEDTEYVTNINNLVKNRLSVSKMILKNDYYKYLLK
jgi:phosphoglycerol transferase MdoB-like AlkP superfamily enzyme